MGIVIKTPEQIEKMKLAGKLSAQALLVGGAAIAPGVTTEEVDRKIHDFILSQGAIPSFLNLYGFPKSACISINDELIHGIPGKKVIKEGDIVTIDVGACINGYHGDNAATFVAGEPSENARRLMDATRECLNRGIAAALAGNRVGDISFAVQSYAESCGFSVVREYVGHGVGKNVHEDPEVPNFGTSGHGPRLVPGMVIAIEPMINEGTRFVTVDDNEWTVRTKDGKLSAHFENTIVITKDGPIILTDPGEDFKI